MLNNLNEKDFKVLRGPFESGRQSPGNLGTMLIISAFLQALVFFLTYFVAGDRTAFPFYNQLFMIHLVITGIIMILSIIYGIPAVYRRSQVMQYVITIFVTLNLFGAAFYICSLFLIWPDTLLEMNKPGVIRNILISLVIGVLVPIVTWTRFMILLKKGEYRAGSKKAELRGRFESKSLLVPAVVIGTGISMFLQSAFKNMTGFDGNVMMIVLLGPLLFYTMLFVLPEQIVLVYCKRRFKSFNFDLEGNLYPIGSGDKLLDKSS